MEKEYPKYTDQGDDAEALKIVFHEPPELLFNKGKSCNGSPFLPQSCLPGEAMVKLHEIIAIFKVDIGDNEIIISVISQVISDKGLKPL